MSISPRFASLAPTLLFLLVASCFGGSSPEPTPSGSPMPTLAPEDPLDATATPVPTFSPTPEVPTGLYPLDVDTGVEAVNQFLALMAAHDIDSIVRDASFIPIPCTTQRTGIAPTPICDDTEADRTPVPSMLHASCEPNYIRPRNRNLIGDGLGIIFQLGTPHLDSVWRTDFWGRRYAVVLVTRSVVQTVAFIIYLDGEGHYAGRATCGDYRMPQGDLAKLFPA